MVFTCLGTPHAQKIRNFRYVDFSEIMEPQSMGKDAHRQSTFISDRTSATD